MPTTTELDLVASELAAQHAPSTNLRRNGKIARLPLHIRHMLNRMLDDGLPYHVVIDELGEHGRGLNSQNITNWVQGGYQDHLKHLDAVERAKAVVEALAQFLQENGDIDVTQLRRACQQVAAIQLFDALRDHGDDALKRLFQATPSKYLNIVHTVCHLSNSVLNVEKHRLHQQLQAAPAQAAAASSQIKVNQAPAEIPAQSQPAPATAPAPTPNPLSSQIKVNQAPAEIPTQLQPASATAPAPTPQSAIKPNQARSSPTQKLDPTLIP
ncbi:MAG TPA: hypothetical protein VG167_11175 [Verrucomicrobiae bacterium]|nr:hypothetical protein [Verrucomicrobiae bacterium]